MEKLTIVNWGAGGQGKSESIKAAFHLLQQKYPSEVLIDDGDIKALIQMGDVLIGLESQGDPDYRQEESLKDFVTKGCQIIICACRSKGSTRWAVEALADQGYRIIWTQNDRTDNPAWHHLFNLQYAERIVRMVEESSHRF